MVLEAVARKNKQKDCFFSYDICAAESSGVWNVKQGCTLFIFTLSLMCLSFSSGNISIIFGILQTLLLSSFRFAVKCGTMRGRFYFSMLIPFLPGQFK